ncbi:hypothetical protein [Paraburkholderia sp. BL6665CI2N2]|uniref:hypothetical protein n=1 Tax=Paraburkholderia sp. BL6665CI2N2 TaxID=1938806 RepID=UPI001416F81D|nr:hypothetical protein [Paraburkholderia sp. BL6665CI2N2]
MATALMMNGQSLYEYFCAGQTRCMNQLKNSHDLSLWITALLRSGGMPPPLLQTPNNVGIQHRMARSFLTSSATPAITSELNK